MSKPGDGRPSLLARYEARVRAGTFADDPAQRALIDRFLRLGRELQSVPQRPGVLARLTGARPKAPRGLYVHGGVGRGKTVLMDDFFATAATTPRRRAHYNAFMNDVQDALHQARAGRKGPQAVDDAVGFVAASVVRETRLLSLDEFMVTDIADAMILSRLFGELFDRGLVLVATSNSAPDDLYRDGLNRGLFLPFVDLLKARLEVFHLSAETDYRLAKLAGEPVYVVADATAARRALDAFWRRLTGTERGERSVLRTRGRTIVVPEASSGVARFTFADLCEAPLGAHDYLQIARAHNTVLVDGIPVIDAGRRDVARRFVLLVDTLYDQHVNLIASAAAEPDRLCPASSGSVAFEFRRTASRLIEMQSQEYLAHAHGADGAALAPQHQSG